MKLPVVHAMPTLLRRFDATLPQTATEPASCGYKDHSSLAETFHHSDETFLQYIV